MVSGSAGGRTDPTQIRLRDLSRTEHDALLALVRKKLRAEFNFPKNKDRYFGVQAVYSLENVSIRKPMARSAACARNWRGCGAETGLRRGTGSGHPHHRRVRVRHGGQGAGAAGKPAKRGITPAEG